MSTAERRSIQGVHFIRVRGTAVERGRAHAALMKEEMRTGALPALAKKNEWMIRRGPGLIQYSAVQESIVAFYKKVLIPVMARSTQPEYRQLMAAMAEESGLPLETFREALFQPEAMMMLTRISLMKHLLKDLPRGGLPGCSSAVALKSWTKSGRLLACRNQDYPIVGPWEPNTTVIFSEPSEAGQIPHVSVTTAGVHTAGLTAINREGLTLFTHAHFGKRVSLQGKPIISLGNEIVRSAKTLGQAIDLARKNTRYANWAFVVTSAKENDAAVIEMSPTETYVRHAQDGFLAHSNFFHAPELQSQEALLSGACCEDLVARICRLREIFDRDRGRLEPHHLSAALGDHIDPQTGEERVFGNTVSVITTVKSTVFDPERQTLWVSDRGESPQGLGDFVEVDIEKFWSRPEAELASRPKLPGYRPKNPALIEGIRHYREAYRAWHMNCHLPDYRENALVSLRKAIRAYPSDGNVWLQAGIVAFRLGLTEEARGHFTGALERKLAAHTKQVAALYLARAHDILGERAKALEIYDAHAEVGEPKLRRAFRRGRSRPYRAAEKARMMIDLQFPDTLQY